MIKTLKTPRLIIRPITSMDAKFLFELCMHQDVGVVTGISRFKNLNASGQYTAGLVNMNKTGMSYHWILESPIHKAAIGFCNFYLPAPHLVHLRNCEASFGLAPSYRGHGYMREALSACLDFMFRSEQFERAEAYVSPSNRPSMLLVEHLGFQQEGLQRKKWVADGLRHDMNLYALLREDQATPPEAIVP